MKNNKHFFIIIKKWMLYFFIIFLMILLALSAKKTIPAAKEALLLCAQNIIPSLFPFFVLSRILLKSGFANSAGKFFSPFMRFLFNTSGESATCFLIGIISGYPMGAKAVCDLYKSKIISKNEAERLLAFCNNSGPLFIIGAVGTTMLGRTDLGLFLYIIHIISAIATGIALRFSSSESVHNTKNFKVYSSCEPFGKIFSDSVSDAVKSTLLICGFVVFFYAVSSPFLYLLPEEGFITTIIKGILEVTAGAKSASFLTSHEVKLCLISAFSGFGGICVFLQVTGIAIKEGLSIKKYLWGKTFQAGFSVLLCSYFAPKTKAVTTFASNVINFETGNFGAMITSVFIICFFYFSILSLRKIRKNIE